MKKLTVEEQISVNGEASWECLQCGYRSAWHLFTSTASQRAYEHESRYGHYGKTRVR
ncbi:hypothetical protein [Streptococcus thoraltensis]|uniref:hypothetical protein n=1 Tax=Streptococcus thoraltensis TaxID=55085 RepID=UPI002A7FCBCE|nr:hypothetical protein [Streptococcus thoraltensis]MDY4761017.1 hypothetical protein [Streptococcus thoraltensis]